MFLPLYLYKYNGCNICSLLPVLHKAVCSRIGAEMRKKISKSLQPFEKILRLSLDRAAEQAAERTAAGRGKEQIPLAACPGRVLAEDIRTDRALPPFDRVTMDGFACRREDLPGPLRLIGQSAAGEPSGIRVGAGSCVKVMTGGILPEGADMVFMVEDSFSEGPDGGVRVLYKGGEPGTCPQNYSPRGEDTPEGKIVLKMGTVLAPKSVAVLASVGRDVIEVRTLPRVGLVSTGNEVVEPWTAPEPHQIRNANAAQSIAQLASLGIVPTYYGIVGDDLKKLEEVIGRAAEENDLILMSGGVSMGDTDFTPDAVENNGFTILYDRVAIKPGRPTTFAVSKGTDFFGLPGNPVSCFVIMEILVKPYLVELMKGTHENSFLFARMGTHFDRKESNREEYYPATINDAGDVYPLEYHGSGHVHALADADVLIRIERGVLRLEKGSFTAVRPL
jgi:molybdopterin molybdotransferase